MSEFTDASHFADDLLKMADYFNGSFEKIIRKACIDLYRRIVERTPVDTGRAKASWQLATYHDDYERPDGEYSASDIQGFINEQIDGLQIDIHEGGIVVIYNNLEYIEQLENGTSQQAPEGMVEVSLSEFEAHFREALRGFKGISST